MGYESECPRRRRHGWLLIASIARCLACWHLVNGSTDVERAIGLIAMTGAWPEIESEVERLLASPHQRLRAAEALAYQQRPELLDLLVSQGLGDYQFNPAALEYYPNAPDLIEPLAFSDDWRIRDGALSALLRLGSSEAFVERLESRVEAVLAKDTLGERPALLELLLLHQAGKPQLQTLLARHGDAAPGAPFAVAAPFLWPAPPEWARAVGGFLQHGGAAQRGAHKLLQELWTQYRDPVAGLILAQP